MKELLKKATFFLKKLLTNPGGYGILKSRKEKKRKEVNKMKTMKNVSFVDAELNNKMYAMGYKFYCHGDFKVLDSIDPWSGMPNVDSNTYFFDTEEEANAFAKANLYPFSNTPAVVRKLEEHLDTWEEKKAKEEKARTEAKAKRLAKETAKAEALGMSLEDYKAMMKKERKIKALKKNIVNLESELEELKAELKKIEKN